MYSVLRTGPSTLKGYREQGKQPAVRSKAAMGYIFPILGFGWAVIFFLISLPLMPVVLLMERYAPKAADRFSYAWVRFGMKMVVRLVNVKVEVIGLENIPKDTAALYIGNHRSIFDVIISSYLIPGRVGYVAKREFSKVPFLNFWMNRIHSVFLDREDIKSGIAMINQCIENMQNGISMYIFPEGTRNHYEGTLLPFHGGSFKSAIRTGMPVIPVTNIGMGDIFEDHKPTAHNRHVRIIFGKPIETKQLKGLQRRELPNQVREIIAQTMEQYYLDDLIPIREAALARQKAESRENARKVPETGTEGKEMGQKGHGSEAQGEKNS